VSAGDVAAIYAAVVSTVVAALVPAALAVAVSGRPWPASSAPERIGPKAVARKSPRRGEGRVSAPGRLVASGR
jgi:hypothetical protein